MTLNQFLLMIKARFKLVLAILLTVVLSATGISLLLPKSYTATASVVLDVKSPDPIAGMVLPALFQPGYMATQVDLLRSERVIRGVIQRLNLTASPELRQIWAKETNSAPGSMEPWLAGLLLDKLDAVPAKESNVINISFSGQDPAFAAAIANAVVDSYIATSLELRVEPAKQYRAMFETQAQSAREKLEQAQAKLSAYQQTNGIVATDERLDIENARLAELSSQLVAVQGARADVRSRDNAAQAASDRSPEALANPVLGRLNSEVALLEARLKETLATHGEAHPQVIQLKANLAELKSKIAAETTKVNASLTVNTRASQERESVIRAALEQQRQKVLSLKAQRDEAYVLIKDVQTAQDAYDKIISRLNQTSLESQSTQTNVSVLKLATAPYKPSGPKVALNIALAFVIGLIFAIGVVACLELWDRVLRTSEDITVSLNLPLLGALGDSRRDTASQGKEKALLGTSRANTSPRLAPPTH